MPLSLAALRDEVPPDAFEAMLAANSATEDMAACPCLEAMSKVCSALETLHKIASGLWTEMKRTDLAYWPWYDNHFAGDYALVRLCDTLDSMISVLDHEDWQHNPPEVNSTRAREADSNLTHLGANAPSESEAESSVSEGLVEVGERIRAISAMVTSASECRQTLEELKNLYRLASKVEVSWAVAEYEGVLESEGSQELDDEGDSFMECPTSATDTWADRSCDAQGLIAAVNVNGDAEAS